MNYHSFYISDVDNSAELKTTGKERMRSERESSRSTYNSNESQNKIKLVKQSDFRDLPMTKKKNKSPKNSSTSPRSFQLNSKKQQGQTNNQT
jgi:hypothetical protein